jgi:hypothetical protein
VDADLLWFYPVFPEPVAIKRGVVSCILHRVPYPVIDESIEIATLHCFNIWREVISGRHIRELPEEMFIDYCMPVKTSVSSDKRRQEQDRQDLQFLSSVKP